MMKAHKCFVTPCLLLAWLGLGCGDDSNGTEQPRGSGGSATGGGGASVIAGMSGSGQGGSGGTMAAAGGSAGSKAPTPPPAMPRELGPPDGIYCQSAFDPPPETCSAGSRCCPNGLGSRREEVCIADGQLCPECDVVTCGQLLCDGPEDCPSAQFCCYAKQGSCSNNADCTPASPTDEDSFWTSTECQARCVPDLRDPDHGMVACKDDRDCPGPYIAGQCRPLNISELPFGINVCYGSDS
jgi:hypothetical protein